jgi:hypothetical protein
MIYQTMVVEHHGTNKHEVPMEIASSSKVDSTAQCCQRALTVRNAQQTDFLPQPW